MLIEKTGPVTWVYTKSCLVDNPAVVPVTDERLKLDTFIDRFLAKGLITQSQANLALTWREDFMMAGLLKLGSCCRNLTRVDQTLFGYSHDHWKRRKAYERWQRQAFAFKRRQDRSDLVDLCCLDLIPVSFHRMQSVKNRLHYLFSLFENEHFED